MCINSVTISLGNGRWYYELSLGLIVDKVNKTTTKILKMLEYENWEDYMIMAYMKIKVWSSYAKRDCSAQMIVIEVWLQQN